MKILFVFTLATLRLSDTYVGLEMENGKIMISAGYDVNITECNACIFHFIIFRMRKTFSEFVLESEKGIMRAIIRVLTWIATGRTLADVLEAFALIITSLSSEIAARVSIPL